MSNGDKGSYLCPFNKFSTSLLSGVKPLLFLTKCSFVIALFPFHTFILVFSYFYSSYTYKHITGKLFKGSIFLKNRHFIIQEKFNKLIYGINTIIKYGT